MKITNLTVAKEPVANGEIGLVCRVTMDTGEQFETAVLWRNIIGLWASDMDEREPAEIAAFLRTFARSIDRLIAEKAA